MAHQRTATAGSEISDDHADMALVDIFGIEGSAAPFQHAVVVLMPGIGQRLQELLEPAGAADILGRRAAGSAHEGRVVGVVITLSDGIEDDVMLPVVAEIVDVKEAINPTLNQGLEPDGTDQTDVTEHFAGIKELSTLVNILLIAQI